MRVNPRPLGAVFADPTDLDLTALLQVAVWLAGALIVIAALCMRGMDRPPLPRLLRRGPLSLYLAFGALAVLSTSYSIEPLYTAFFAVKTLVAVSAVALVVGDSLSLRSARQLLNTFYGVYVFQWALILVCFLADPSLVGTEIPGVGYRLHAALFGDFGASSTVAGFYFLSRALSQKTMPRRMLWVSLYASSLFLLFLSRTRSMVFAAIFGCWILLALHQRRSVRYASLTLSVLAAAIVYLLEWQNDFIAYLMRGQTTTALLSLTGRTNAFDHLLSIWQGSPALGYGFAAGSRVFLMSFVYEYGMSIGSAHDALSKVLIELGIVGCTVLSTCVLYSLLKLVSAWRRSGSDPVRREMWQHALALMLFAVVSSVVSGGVADISFAFLISVALAEVLAAKIVRCPEALQYRVENSVPRPVGAGVCRG